MKAQLLHGFGDVSHFRAGEIPRPGPKPGQVLIRVAASSVNPVDTKIRQNGPAFAPRLPAVLGMDVAGVVEEVGDGVEGFAPGDEVYGCAGGLGDLQGALAEFMPADARLVAPKPKTLSLREAAALPLVSITAWEGLYDRAAVRSGESVLVHAGTGGVGHLAVQLAKARGARVVATVSSPEKAAIARGLGADDTVNYREESVADYVARLTAGRGFDVVFDSVGGDNLDRAFEAARINGRVVSIVTRQSYDLTPMHMKGLSLHVVLMLLPMIHDIGRERHGEILRELAALVDEGRVRPLIDDSDFTLGRIAEAHTRLESGQAIGKVVVTIP